MLRIVELKTLRVVHLHGQGRKIWELTPVCCVFNMKVGKHYIVDATSEEESQMMSAVSIAVNRKGVIRGLTKRGGFGLEPSVLIDMLSFAQKLGQTLIPTIDLKIAAAESNKQYV